MIKEEKRFFADWYRKYGILTNFIVTLLIISCTVLYVTTFETNNSELEDDYKYHEKVCEMVIQEGKGIDILKIPKDIEYWQVEYSEDSVIFKFYRKKGIFSQKHPFTVKLSKDFKILSKPENYVSEKDIYNLYNIFYSIVIGLLFSYLIWFFLFICFAISAVNQKRMEKIELEKKAEILEVKLRS